MKKQKRALTNKEKQAVNKIMKKAEKKGLKGKKKRTFRDDVIGFIIDFGILFTLGMLGLPSFGTNEDTDIDEDISKMKSLREKFGAARARANYQRQTGQSIDQRHAQLKKAADKATARRKAADKDVEDFAKERKAKLRAMGIKDDVNENKQKEDVQLDEISRGMKALKKNFGPAVDPKAYSIYKKFVKKHKIDEPTVRMCTDNPNDAECKRMMKDKNIAQAVKLRKASMKESVKESAAMRNLKLINKIKKSGVVKQGSMAKDTKKEDRFTNRSADKKPEKYIGPDGKTRIRMVPVDKEIQKEATIPQGKTVMTKRPDLTRDDAEKLAKLKKMMDRERAARKNK